MSGLRYLEDLQMGHTSITHMSASLLEQIDGYRYSPSSSRRETLSVKSAILTD